eukprot:CAMPEP_0201491340 /NCGR_PEP_ID=MMETSP0151_2-20130828/29438_1 /ASSEMBLY_ACC=CAM_ASM_000257 /TAXON_ID=200890 /ORGANISM="Paramoeba atlantica, Strain 621/1 / CCAP 1560/9" /LENGTH=237 /DNA_ID=CAMNT_0047877641 /DNA_START=44 /DNA_END=757 /DNA_ORIENTATION=-
MASVPKQIAVFDFDDTIIDDNSDTRILRLIPDIDHWEYYTEGHWTKMMDDMAGLIFERGLKEKSVREVFEETPFVPGILELLLDLKKREIPIYILSDANTYFISCILEQKNLHTHFSGIISNPASFTEQGRLSIRPHQPSTHKTHHSCQSCPMNLCKGLEIQRLVGSLEGRPQVFYFGDGGNDWCAGRHLQQGDILFPRRGRRLEQLALGSKGELDQRGVKLFCWENALECLVSLDS